MNRLRELRLSRKLSTIELGRFLNLDPSLLTHIEKGRKNFSVESLSRACEYFGVSADYMLGKSAEEMFNDFADSMKDFMTEKEWPDGDITQSLSSDIPDTVKMKIEILLILREINDLSSLAVIYDTAKLQSAKNDFSTPLEED